MHPDLHQYFQSQKQDMVGFLKTIVQMESPSDNKKAVDACSSFVVKEMEKEGASVTCFPQEKIGNIYLVSYPSPYEKEESILILTHIDTVFPVGRIKEMPFRREKEKIYGPGVLDMKAGLVMSLFSLKAINSFNLQTKKNIFLLINSAEEISSEDSYQVIREWARKASCVLCLEPALPGGALKIQRKGRMVVRMTTTGKAAHAGTPDKGINAIEELIFQLEKIKKIRNSQGTTFNIGTIQGGEKINIVPEKAQAYLDIRFWKSSQKQNILRSFRQLNPVHRSASIHWKVESSTPPMEKSEESEKLFFRVQKLAQSLGLSLEAGKTGGGSDASIASSLGIPTLDGLGPDGKGIHSIDEHLILPSLLERSSLLTKILCEL